MAITIQDPYLSGLQKTETAKTAGQNAAGTGSQFKEALAALQENGKDQEKPSFQIGGKSYTQEEWDKMISDFDRQAEKIREEIREEIEDRQALEEAKEAGTYQESEVTDEQIAALFVDRD